MGTSSQTEDKTSTTCKQKTCNICSPIVKQRVIAPRETLKTGTVASIETKTTAANVVATIVILNTTSLRNELLFVNCAGNLIKLFSITHPVKIVRKLSKDASYCAIVLRGKRVETEEYINVRTPLKLTKDSYINYVINGTRNKCCSLLHFLLAQVL